MNLRIERICEATMTVKGTLDGFLPLAGEFLEGKVRVRIADWAHEVSDDILTGADFLRYAVFAAISAYRRETSTNPTITAGE